MNLNILVNSIFYLNTTNNGSYYDDLLNFNKSVYFKKNKGICSRIEYMTGEYYFKSCLNIFRDFKNFEGNLDEIKKERKNSVIGPLDRFEGANLGENKIEYLKRRILQGNKMGMPYLDYVLGFQEGLHRIMAASEIVGWDKKFPVLVISKYRFFETEKELKSYMLKCIEDATKIQGEQIYPLLPTNKLYTEKSFIDSVRFIFENELEKTPEKKDIRIEDIELGEPAFWSKRRELTISLTYFDIDYKFIFSLRDPEDLTKSWFIIEN